MKTCETMLATIFVGLRAGYDGPTGTVGEVRDICLDFCSARGLCVTVTETTFVYSRGWEPGVIVGIMNYPRFPKTSDALRKTALALAARLKRTFGQLRVSIVFDDETIMLEEDE